MYFRYSVASGILSAAAVMLAFPLIGRTRWKNGIFSAYLGIIIFRIVKSVIVECGWGFAAAAGIRTGLILESLAMCCGLVLFREVGELSHSENELSCFSPAASVILFCSGKGIMSDISLAPSAAEYIIGRAAVAALVSISVFQLNDEGNYYDHTSMIKFSLICNAGSIVLEYLLRMWTGCEQSVSAPFLIMLSCCGLLYTFAEGIKNASQIAPIGFATGILISYGFDCVMC